jgi:hypothetical protein
MAAAAAARGVSARAKKSWKGQKKRQRKHATRKKGFAAARATLSQPVSCAKNRSCSWRAAHEDATGAQQAAVRARARAGVCTTHAAHTPHTNPQR